jgi:peptide/nickel transport system permease protein
MTTKQILQEIRKSRIGIIGIGILGLLILLSILTVVFIPIDTYQQWNNPASWTSFPKSASPAWINYFLEKKIPEHQIVHSSQTVLQKTQSTTTVLQKFEVDYNFDYFPSEIIFQYDIEYEGSAMLRIDVARPDGLVLRTYSSSLPHSESKTVHSERIFYTNDMIKKNLFLQSGVLKGTYVFSVSVVGFSENSITHSSMILGGNVFGLAGTDELRRDLSIGLLWGIPIALFIGIVVSIGSVVSGLVFGVYAGYKGGKTDESMMRFNDIVYALPALPFLIILSVTTSNSIFLLIGFLMLFGWVGVAKVSRSISLQIKTRQFVDAAKTMGQKDVKIIFKHIIPQILPYALASIAISVPAAITTEAGLSFLGLGDPTFPTWGQILHDAKSHGAAARGLWWWVIPPGIMIAVTGLAFVFIGNALESIANPKLKR